MDQQGCDEQSRTYMDSLDISNGKLREYNWIAWPSLPFQQQLWLLEEENRMRTNSSSSIGRTFFSATFHS